MKIIAAIALYIGVVDSVNDKYAYVEITTSEEIIFTSITTDPIEHLILHNHQH